MKAEKSEDKVYEVLKKTLGVAVVIFIVAFLYMHIQEYKCRVSLEEYIKNADIEQLNDYLYIEEGCSLDEAELTEQFINALPSSFWQEFRSDNGTIYIIKDIPIDMVAGRTELKTNTIYIKDGYVFDALAHEFFHYYLSKNPINNFTEIYKEEAEGLMKAYYGEDSEYFYSNEEEYLCQLFQTVFVIGREDKFGVAPKSWEYMVNILDAM